LLEPSEFIIHKSATETVRDLDHAHVWFCNLDEQNILDERPVFSAEEVARATRLKSPLDCRRFLARCAFVRQILGGLTSRSPETLKFDETAKGKPILAAWTRKDEVSGTLNFNLSHSENILGLIAAFDRNVGMDLEMVNSGLDLLRMGWEHLAAEDFRLLLESKAEERLVLFYRLWTRREAVWKMRGIGIVSNQHESAPLTSSNLYPFEFVFGGKHVIGALALEAQPEKLSSPPAASF